MENKCGKILKVSSNDLYGNASDKIVDIFAVFNYKKYMNKYVIFTNNLEYEKKKLYYGSVFFKEDTIVIFNIKETDKTIIDMFLNEFTTNNLNEFEVLDISNFNRVELVNYNTLDYENLNLLNELSIQKEEKVEEVKNKNDTWYLWVLLFILIIILGALTYLYFNPELLVKHNKKLSCEITSKDKETSLKYTEIKEIMFDEYDKTKVINVIDTYIFKDNTEYNLFKDNDKHIVYFQGKDSYRYNDNDLELKIFYKDKIIIDDYSEMLSYLKSNGFTCQEEEYDE